MVEQESKEKEVFPVVNHIKEYEDSFKQNLPLSQPLKGLLEDFNGYDLEKDIARRGRGRIESDLTNINSFLDQEDVQGVITKGISRAQSIYPEVELKGFPVHLIYAGGVTDARAPRDSIVFNLGCIVGRDSSNKEILEYIQSASAHESVHKFVRQLGLKPESYESTDEEILHKMWEEGLTTYVESVHRRQHDIFLKDIDFWITSVRDWMRAKGDEERREEILDSCFNRESFKNWFDNSSSVLKEYFFKEKELEDKFLALLFNGNGPGYHIGYMIWKEQLKEGVEIKDILKNGSSHMREWLESYRKEN